ncbi:hypothetical protein BV898_11659 [Hypsibius exemplaris]|uniref:Methyltransferase domain-containing protein n=1 Tax=Hypsibius exemplaris TaxID=2072580 RepID=A0A1W0WG63_HYPEX|nr:hypothetical protein BV898_11659 [Hypsibius exemplaris]
MRPNDARTLCLAKAHHPAEKHHPHEGRTRLTRFLTDRVYQKLPHEWLQAFNNLSNEELRIQLENWTENGSQAVHNTFPDSFRSFLQDVQRLSLDRQSDCCAEEVDYGTGAKELEVPNHLTYGMSVKKLHEVSRMAVSVNELCQENGIRTIVDLGAGLGYLDCVLSEVLGYKVVAVESNESRTGSAKERAVRHSRKHPDQSTGSLHYATLRIGGSGDQDTTENLRTILADCDVGDEPICLIGLHCCGDLTPLFLQTFHQLGNATAFICVGCCYHLMTPAVDRSEIQFCPLSWSAKEMKRRLWLTNDLLLTVPSLRLASQETRVTPCLDELDTQVEGHFFRAVLESVADEFGVLLRRNKRHPGAATNNGGRDFESQLTDLARNYCFTGTGTKSIDLDSLHTEMRERKMQFKELLPSFRLFRILQGLMQGVLETFIAVDRYLHVKEDLHVLDARCNRDKTRSSSAIQPNKLDKIIQNSESLRSITA